MAAAVDHSRHRSDTWALNPSTDLISSPTAVKRRSRCRLFLDIAAARAVELKTISICAET